MFTLLPYPLPWATDQPTQTHQAHTVTGGIAAILGVIGGGEWSNYVGVGGCV